MRTEMEIHWRQWAIDQATRMCGDPDKVVYYASEWLSFVHGPAEEGEHQALNTSAEELGDVE